MKPRKSPRLAHSGFFRPNPLVRMDFRAMICYPAPNRKAAAARSEHFCLWRRAEAGLNQTKGT
jgi:hypothetical protein